METTSPNITLEEGVWVIRIESPTGKVQEYRCATEGQAKSLALVLAPNEGAVAR